MKRNVLIFGIVLGTILAGNMVYMVNMVYHHPDFVGNDVVGYAAMVIVFSLTFFGIRNYRNKELGGVISFGRAFKTGALIAFVGSSMYVGVWLFYYYLFVPDFLDKYELHQLTQCMKEGFTEAQVTAKKQEMAQFREMYQNPIFVILISYAEVLPIGLLVALVSSFFLRKKRTPPESVA